MKKILFYAVLLICLSSIPIQAATQFEITGPVGSGSFGTHVAILPNGNFVVTDPTFDITSPQTIIDAGAVYLFNSSGTLISTITGNCANDNIGSGGITVLTNGNYVIKSPGFDYADPNGSTNNNCLNSNSAGAASTTTLVRRDAGAVTLGFAGTGVSGVVSAANSFIGSFNNDRVGEITALPNGNYLVQARFWNIDRGAIAWRNGAVASTGFMTESNSQFGNTSGDFIGKALVLPNGNYVVFSSTWNQNRGVVSVCNVPTGCTGAFSSANALIGSPGDDISFDGFVVLTNSNFVVISRTWNNDRGAVTLVNGTTGTTGVVSEANSLVGSAQNDFVGSGGVTPLTNGNYVVSSPVWKNSSAVTIGAATFGNGTTGTSGLVSTANSLVGNAGNDFFLSKIVALTNGNYVVALPSVDIPSTAFSGAAVWGSGTTGIAGNVTTANSLYRGGNDVVALTNGNYVVVSQSALGTGAVTWANGSTGITGEISAANSLVGSTGGDSIGFSGGGTTVTALTNGNYVVSSSSWDNAGIPDVGAVTLCSGATGFIGVVSASNSLIGTQAQDQVGYGGSIALANGNYAVRSYLWNNGSANRAGAVTFGSGTTGITGPVSPANSLVGSSPNDNVGGAAVTALPNGNYVVTSIAWSNRGAVTWGNGTTGTIGAVSAANSVIGSSNDDRVGTLGNNPSIKAYSDSAYTFHSANWDNNGINDAGAVSLGKANSAVTGEINVDNSVRGTIATTGTSLVYDYSPQKKFLVVGSLNRRTVTVFRYQNLNYVYDFDGDSKTDVSIYRPTVGEWWIDRSSTSQTIAAQFGTSTDKAVPADYTGDGKTDIAFFRPQTGEWFILRSEDGSFYSIPFGTSDDIPVPADYDGDGQADPAVFRPSNQFWYIQRSTGGVTISQFGAHLDKPVPADYDGDGKADLAIYRASAGEWWINRSGNNTVYAFQFGTASDNPVQGDFTGDGRADAAFFRQSTGEWFILRSENGSFYSVPFGAFGDLPVPGDYDGDGKLDTAVFRLSSSTWYVQRSSAGLMIQQFGAAGDQPVPGVFVP